jgi:hypothetical protein
MHKSNNVISNSAGGGLSKSLNFLSNSTRKHFLNSSNKKERESLKSGRPVKTQDTEIDKLGMNSFSNLVSPIKSNASLAMNKYDNSASSTIGQLSQISSPSVNKNLGFSENQKLDKNSIQKKINRSTTLNQNNLNFSSNLKNKIHDAPVRNSNVNFVSAQKPSAGQNLISDFKMSIKNNSNTINNFKRNTENFNSSNNFQVSKNKFNLRGSSEIKKFSSPFNKTQNFKNNKFSFLMVSPEDEVFDQYQHDELTIAKNKKPFIENIPRLDSVTKKLLKVYRMDYDYLKGVQKAKNRKNDLDLENYQNNLVQVVGNRFSKESMRKLTEKLKQIRLVSNKFKKEENIDEFIENIEKVEEGIISNLMRKEEKLEYLRGNKLISANVPLPKIKYKRIRKVSIPAIPEKISTLNKNN